jgi:hypothetical protein
MAMAKKMDGGEVGGGATGGCGPMGWVSWTWEVVLRWLCVH